jgi:DNA-binding FadR family transcriptional regulator
MHTHAKPNEPPQTVRDFIVGGMLDGTFKPGDKLPTERALADQFQTGRSRVRGVLAELANERRVVRAIGRGTFVAALASNGAAERETALPASPAAVMDARLALETALIGLVVRNATQVDFDEMARCVERAGRAETLNSFEYWDTALHKAIAAATHNRLIIAFSEVINATRQQDEWGRLKRNAMTPQRRSTYQRQHQQIVAALQARDEARARNRMLQHLRDVRRHLLDL